MPNSIFLFPGNPTFVGPVTSNNGFLANDGTAGAPSYSFINEPTTGLFATATPDLRIAVGGGTAATWSGGGVNLGSGYAISWAGDTSLVRGGAAGKIVLTGTTPMLQLGGTTSSFPALKQNSSNIDVRVADDSAYAGFTAAFLSATASFRFNGTIFASATAPTISSGFGTSPSIANNNGTASFVVNVGTGGTATNGVIGMPAATTGWILSCIDITAASGHTGLRTVQTASTTTSATIESQNSAGTATAWATGSLVRVIAMAY